MHVHRKIRLFVASPSDVTRERDCLAKIVEILNRRLANKLGYVLEIRGWLEVPPDMGAAESVILRHLPMESFDIFVGILWQRFGSPTGGVAPDTGRRFISGTEEEFVWAYNHWKKHGGPRIMFYRRTSSPGNVRSRQYRHVCSFFKEFDAVGGEHPGLYQTYRDLTEFSIKLIDHLEEVLLTWGQAAAVAASSPETETPQKSVRRSLATQVPSHFFQVLIPEFKLSQKEGKKTLNIEVHDDLEPIQDRFQREEFRERLIHLGGAQTKLQRDLRPFARRKKKVDLIKCPNWPLRYGNGGVLPIVGVDVNKYICLFYREVFPIGWNIANGASDNYQELLFPERMMLREFGEELLIADGQNQVFRCFYPGKDILCPGYQSAARIAWNEAFPKYGYQNYRNESLKVAWVHGPDSISVRVGETNEVSSGFFLNITPEDNAIEVDRVAYLRLPQGANLLDGEVTENKPVGRIIGLFEFSTFQERLKKGNFQPDLFFFEGRECSRELSFDDARARFIKQTHPNVEECAAIAKQNVGEPGLCPISDSMIRNYFRCLKAGLVKEPPKW